MISKIFIAATFLVISSTAPIDHHDGATSYVSLSLGGHSQGNPQYQPSSAYVQKEIPTLIKYPTYSSLPTYSSVPTYNQHEEKEYGPAQYEFKYSVEDKQTGDIKSQHEVRNGDKVQGEYSLHEADGTIRTVKYSADKHSGFNAVVERTGHAAHPEVVPVKPVPITYDYYKH
ncbi:cuticle protein 7-like [Onthophagus taurus]|uniref:cuticle protein 7-like n=1 Tax=Onthophagus taurus TaxID=166361 RepID=UPI0039BE9C47